jgi:hypothetical protein
VRPAERRFGVRDRVGRRGGVSEIEWTGGNQTPAVAFAIGTNNDACRAKLATTTSYSTAR